MFPQNVIYLSQQFLINQNYLTMKKANLILITVVSLFLTSCSMNSGLVNQFTTYNNGTNVVLQEANFKVVGQVTGKATNSYFFGFGGFKNLVSLAKQDMLKNAALDGTSKAIINMSLETQHNFYMGIFQERTVIIHGTVIEFMK